MTSKVLNAKGRHWYRWHFGGASWRGTVLTDPGASVPPLLSTSPYWLGRTWSAGYYNYADGSRVLAVNFLGGDFSPEDDGGDIIDAGAGNDVVDGDFGNDVIDGGLGLDLMWGGYGNDTLRGGTGDDLLTSAVERVTQWPQNDAHWGIAA